MAKRSGSGKKELTAERLRALYIYDPETGEFRRRPKPPKREGWISQGYRRMCIGGYDYQEHRLAWLYVYGEWPKQVIDHINKDKLDNRIGNLRDVPEIVNARNRPDPKRKTKTGLIGVHLSNKGPGFIATLSGVYLGTFPTAEIARQVYLKAREKRDKNIYEVFEL